MLEDPPPAPRRPSHAPRKTDAEAATLAQRHGYTRRRCPDCDGTGYLRGGADATSETGWTPCDEKSCLGTGSLCVRRGEPPLNDAQIVAKFGNT